MATELGKAYVQIVPSAKGISGSITKELKGESESAGKSAGTSIVSTMKKVFAAAAIGKALMSTIKEGAKLEQSLGGIETLFKDNADTVKKYAQEAYKTAGLGANEYMENVTSFSASLLQSLGGDTKKAAEVSNMAMIDMADNSNKMGSSMESIQNAYKGFAKQNYTMLDNLSLGYGGTKGEMERLLADAQKLTGVKYDINNLNDVYEAIHAIQGEIGITGTTALEAAETFSGSFAAMKAAFQNTLGSLALGENIKSSLEGLAQTISTFMFGNLFPMLGTIIASLPSALSVFIETAISGITDNVGKSMSGSFPEFLQHGIDTILNFVNGILKEAPTVYKNIGDMMVKMLDKLLKAIPDILNAGKKLIAGLAKGWLDNAPAVMVAVIETLSKIISKIIEHLPQILQTGVSLIISLAAGLIKSIPNVVTAIPTIIAAIIRAIIGLTGDFIGAGKDLMLGFAKGIGDSVGDVVKRAREAAERILSEVKGFFGINSPSRVFMKIGENLNLGLAKGIEDNLNPVTRAMDSLENTTTGDLTKSMMLRTSMESRALPNASNLSTNGSNGSSTNNFSIDSLIVREEADVKKIAKELFDLQQRNSRGRGIMAT